MTHEQKKEAARLAIESLRTDTSVTIDTVYESLDLLRSEIADMLFNIDEEIEEQDDDH